MKILHKHKDKLLEAEQQRKDVGFGTQLTDPAIRLVNRDGSFNVKRTNDSRWARMNVFNRLITCSWQRFIAMVMVIFILTNLIFAIFYEIVGVENLHGIDLSTPSTRFWDAFFFSAQTITTVGYGRIAPYGFGASLVASIESLMGLLAFAIATGLLYGRFSRPIARILYSENALISPYLDITGLMFRIINERSHQLIEAQVEVTFSILEKKDDGKTTRNYFALKLERNKVNFFPTNWTLVHPITEDSPLFGMSHEELIANDGEILILFKATEDTFNQMVQSRTSYHSREIIWGAKFQSMLKHSPDNVIVMDLAKLSDYNDVPLVSEYEPKINKEHQQTV
jgi:inward rectifier potassium channel